MSAPQDSDYKMFSHLDKSAVDQAYWLSDERYRAIIEDPELMLVVADERETLALKSDLLAANEIARAMVMHRYRMWVPNFAFATQSEAIAAEGGVAVLGSVVPTEKGLEERAVDDVATEYATDDAKPDGAASLSRNRYLKPFGKGGSMADRMARQGVVLVDFSANKNFDALKFHESLRARPHPEDRASATPEVVMLLTGWDLGPFGPPRPAPQPAPGTPPSPNGTGVSVLVMDSGIVKVPDFQNPEVAGAQPLEVVVNPAFDIYDDRDDPYTVRVPGDDTLSTLGHGAVHGTFIAGQIATGAPGATLLVSRVCSNANRHLCSDWEVLADLSSALAALHSPSATQPPILNQPVVVNMSFGSPVIPASNAFAAALIELLNEYPNTVIVASAGNRSTNHPFYPAAIPHSRIISVGSIRHTANGPVCSAFSNYGSWVKIWTDGEDIVGPFIHGSMTVNGTNLQWTGPQPHAYWSGTSFAAPGITAKLARALSGGSSIAAAVGSLQGPVHPVRVTSGGSITELGVVAP